MVRVLVLGWIIYVLLLILWMVMSFDSVVEILWCCWFFVVIMLGMVMCSSLGVVVRLKWNVLVIV